MQRAFFSYAVEVTPWHAACGAIPFEVLLLINERVAPAPLPLAHKRGLTYQAQNVELRGQVDRLNQLVDDLQAGHCSMRA